MSYSEFAAIMGKVGVAKGKEYLNRWIAEQDSVVVEVKNPVTPVKEHYHLQPSRPTKPRRLSPLYDPELGETIYPVETMLRDPQLHAAYRQSSVLFAALARDCAPCFIRDGATIRRASHK
jgi:hypothetical protein